MRDNFGAVLITTFIFFVLTSTAMIFWDAGTMNGAKIAYDCYTNAADVDVCQSRLEDIIWPSGK